MTGPLARILQCVCLLVLLFGVTHAGETGFDFKGVQYVSFWHNEYLWPEAPGSQDDIAASGANWAGVLVTWYADSLSGHELAPLAEKTPEDAAVIAAIQGFKARGLKVMLKPHIDVIGGAWRGLINPADPGQWFANYTQFITRYAALAQEQGVDLFCVGTELRTISGAGFTTRWHGVIDAVKTVYSGPLTYSALAEFASSDEHVRIQFWDRLDFAGVNAYARLALGTNPSVPELVAAWRAAAFGENYVEAMRLFHERIGKPVIFTEIGYQSSDGTNRMPVGVSPVQDLQEQADCYEAALQVWSGQPWMRGMLWWGWEIRLPLPEDTHFSPRGKPAQTVLGEWYGGLRRPPGIAFAEAWPNPALRGEPVYFVARGTAAGVGWRFDDGCAQAGALAVHAFESPGDHLAFASVPDGAGGFVEKAVPVAVQEASFSGSAPACGAAAQPLDRARFTFNLDFTRLAADRATFTAGLSGLDATATLTGTRAIVSINGILLHAPLDSLRRGSVQGLDGATAGGTLRFTLPRRGISRMTLSLSSSTLASALQVDDTPLRGALRRDVTVTVLAGGRLHQATLPGAIGRARYPRR